MGMFAWVKSEYSLPQMQPPTDEFQTKDAFCNLDVYTLDKDGILWVEYQDWSMNDLGDKKLSHFDGEMYFYGSTKATGRMQEYLAVFIDGTLETVEKVNYGP